MLSPVERILGNVDHIPMGCWLWKGNRHKSGYGRISIAGRLWYVHRALYELTVGPVPDGFELDHLCRVKHCCNPDHLEVVTHQTNQLRGTSMAARHAAKTQCPAGHPYSAENTRINNRGERVCITCARSYRARRRERQAAIIAGPGHR